jgi:hypothetical protein
LFCGTRAGALAAEAPRSSTMAREKPSPSLWRAQRGPAGPLGRLEVRQYGNGLLLVFGAVKRKLQPRAIVARVLAL